MFFRAGGKRFVDGPGKLVHKANCDVLFLHTIVINKITLVASASDLLSRQRSIERHYKRKLKHKQPSNYTLPPPMILDPTGPSHDEQVISLPGEKYPIPLSLLRTLYLPGEDTKAVWGMIPKLPAEQRRKILVTGGAGFVGSHLVDRLMLLGHEILIVDNLSTGRRENVEHWIGHENFTFLEHDVIEPLHVECDLIYHLACPASPPHYQADEIKTVKTCIEGTLNMLGLAKRTGAMFLLTSTSEVYGDPEVHPQPEDYRGCVNTIGIRACYDEGKRCAETLTYCYQRQHGVDVRVARIFNTYGPRMDPEDGRVVSNFIMQALSGKPITIYGDGNQTRSFQFVHDLVSGLMALMESSYTLPVNLGNPEEYQIKEFATIIRDIIESNSSVVNMAAAPDDPQQRRPNIDRAKKVLQWDPKYLLRSGLVDTVEYFRRIHSGGV